MKTSHLFLLILTLQLNHLVRSSTKDSDDKVLSSKEETAPVIVSKENKDDAEFTSGVELTSKSYRSREENPISKRRIRSKRPKNEEYYNDDDMYPLATGMNQFMQKIKEDMRRKQAEIHRTHLNNMKMHKEMTESLFPSNFFGRPGGSPFGSHFGQFMGSQQNDQFEIGGPRRPYAPASMFNDWMQQGDNPFQSAFDVIDGIPNEMMSAGSVNQEVHSWSSDDPDNVKSYGVKYDTAKKSKTDEGGTRGKEMTSLRVKNPYRETVWQGTRGQLH